eukprot:TRINITY_DN95546_c0_g1_i1.p1 TRINITY_DN95546_c0_g1~~TRINITY_DN95546_c0_g1_i1.p1  ORF type:complete len:129 (-),score=14.84 TRINITY_DN95546_c0_g1_i1:270-656(-)
MPRSIINTSVSLLHITAEDRAKATPVKFVFPHPFWFWRANKPFGVKWHMWGPLYKYQASVWREAFERVRDENAASFAVHVYDSLNTAYSIACHRYQKLNLDQEPTIPFAGVVWSENISQRHPELGIKL